MPELLGPPTGEILEQCDRLVCFSGLFEGMGQVVPGLGPEGPRRHVVTQRFLRPRQFRQTSGKCKVEPDIVRVQELAVFEDCLRAGQVSFLQQRRSQQVKANRGQVFRPSGGWQFLEFDLPLGIGRGSGARCGDGCATGRGRPIEPTR